MAEPDRTNAVAERVSDIVARLPRWNPRLGGVFEQGDQPFVYMAKDGLGEWVRRSEAADIIEAQSKALAEAREILRRALDCGTAVVGADPSDPDAEEAFSMWSDARTAGRQFLVGARS